jgi:hypothetical protein
MVACPHALDLAFLPLVAVGVEDLGQCSYLGPTIVTMLFSPMAISDFARPPA